MIVKQSIDVSGTCLSHSPVGIEIGEFAGSLEDHRQQHQGVFDSGDRMGNSRRHECPLARFERVLISVNVKGNRPLQALDGDRVIHLMATSNVAFARMIATWR